MFIAAARIVSMTLATPGIYPVVHGWDVAALASVRSSGHVAGHDAHCGGFCDDGGE